MADGQASSKRTNERTNGRPCPVLRCVRVLYPIHPHARPLLIDTQTPRQRRRTSKAREKHSGRAAADDTQVVCALRCSCDYGNGSWTIQATSRAISRANHTGCGSRMRTLPVPWHLRSLSPQPLEPTCLHCPDGTRTPPWLVSAPHIQVLSTVFALSNRVESSRRFCGFGWWAVVR
ncbi:hypothetical protein BDZ97DRAFT_1822984 [Flammula alnicola]|nr:hypothetical protein BDZ97DRAFT_1822984 [Flammula alnicola]